MPLPRFAVAAVLAMTNFAIHAEDWPAWTGPLGRNVARETNLPADFDRDSGRNIKWVAELGDVAFGAPTVSQGRVYIGTNLAALRDDPRFDGLQGGVLACLDEATGKPLWYLVTPVRTEGFPPESFAEEQRWGICSSPTVDGDRVYVITNGDDLLCLDVKGLRDGNDGPFEDEAVYMAGEGQAPVTLNPDSDADILWRYDIPRELEVAPHDVASGSVLVLGDVLYASTSNGIGRYRSDGATDAVNPDAPAVIALSKHTGALIATDDTPISRELFHAQWASPSMGVVTGSPMVAVGGSDGVCYAFEPIDDSPSNPNRTLKTRWSFDANPRHYRTAADGSPIDYAAGDYRRYQRRAELNQSIEAFNNDTGKKAIDRRINLSNYNSSDGTYTGPSEILATPVFCEDKVYVLTGRDPLHGLGKGALSCIDATKTGNVSNSGLVWRFEVIGRSMSSVAVDAGLVYAADLAGRVYCLDALSGALQWQHETEDEIWGNPLIADGKLYISARRSFWVFATGKDKEVLFTSRGGSETGPIAANGVVYAFIRCKLYAIAEGT